MTVLGLNAYHADSSACIIIDGQLVAAAEEERFRRVKHWAGFPKESIYHCLKEAGITFATLDHIAINTDPKANFLKKLNFTLSKHPDIKLIFDRIKNIKKRISIEEEIANIFKNDTFSGKVHYVEHHLTHLASSFFVSPFERAVSLSVDGFGDFASTAWGLGIPNKMNIDGRILFPHSLGIFYQSLTQFIGFPNYGDEYKVMGLASYGEPKYMKEMGEILKLYPNGTFKLELDFFRHHKSKFKYNWSDGAPEVGQLFNDNLIQLMGKARTNDEPISQRHKDIACSAQKAYEEALFSLLNNLHRKYDVDALALSGGCAMNSVANGKIRSHTPFKNIYIQSAAGDAGGAIGAAIIIAKKFSNANSGFKMEHAYWGPKYCLKDIETLLKERYDDLSSKYYEINHVKDEDSLCKLVATYITERKVVGWFQGRMEWGPRALGNRSILCDPRQADMKDILNLKIKRRESFRPFAPSILREYLLDWFEQEADVPFMMQVLQIRKEKRVEIPAVTHVDGSGRLQTVTLSSNPRYYKLISEFNSLTRVPILLNTSFNENEPVVCKPEEALNCFMRTKMDVLVLENWVVKRIE